MAKKAASGAGARKRAPAKKKAAKKTAAAATQSTSDGKVPKGQLGDWLDKVPEDVQKLADDYDAAHTAKAKATAKFNGIRDNLIEKMRETGTPRVRIRSGDKVLELDDQWKVKIAKPVDKGDGEKLPF